MSSNYQSNQELINSIGGNIRAWLADKEEEQEENE